jgi:hypothetical protein
MAISAKFHCKWQSLKDLADEIKFLKSREMLLTPKNCVVRFLCDSIADFRGILG